MIRLRLIAAALLALVALQAGGTVAAGGTTPRPRSCVVPMPCCAKGFCPLHAHGAHARSPTSARWLHCDDDAPLVRLPAAGPPAVFAAGDVTAALPGLAHALAARVVDSPPSRAPEPELHPPQAPLAS